MRTWSLASTDRPISGRRTSDTNGIVRTSRQLQAAALPWRRTPSGIEIMLVTSRGRGHWLLPKGWPDRNERLHDAASREAYEEAGLKGIVAMQEFGRYFYHKRMAASAIACEVSVFPLRVVRVADKWKESGQRSRKWMGPSEAMEAVQQPDLRALIAAFFETAARNAA